MSKMTQEFRNFQNYWFSNNLLIKTLKTSRVSKAKILKMSLINMDIWSPTSQSSITANMENTGLACIKTYCIAIYATFPCRLSKLIINKSKTIVFWNYIEILNKLKKNKLINKKCNFNKIILYCIEININET